MNEKKEKILFVEDDSIDQIAIKRMTGDKNFPFDSDIAVSVSTARDLISENDYAVVILDYFLGDGTAFDLFGKVQGAPIIIVTGIGDEEVAVKAMKAGAYDYIVKDQDGNHLKTLPVTIENVLKRYQTERELTRYREHLELLVRDRTEDLQKEVEERKKAESLVRKSLEEKELLMREVHHRVKNNMQIVSSILSLQANELGNSTTREADIIREGENRIRSMALVHDSLYEANDFTRVDFKLYIFNLINNIRNCYRINDTHIMVDIDVEDVPLSINKAIPCAQIINELVTNSIKYAFPEGRKGRIAVSLKKRDDGFRLTVADNGIGTEDPQPGTFASSIGMQLAEALTDQLNGAIELNREEGTAFTIDFSG